MPSKILPFQRRPIILRTLQMHGPLSVRGLVEIIEPKMSERRMQDALHRLEKTGLIHKRRDFMSRKGGSWYQLSQEADKRKRLADILKIASDETLAFRPRTQELLHSQDCAIWTTRLKRIFPEATIVRDIQFDVVFKNSNNQNADKKEVEVRPDIILRFKEKNQKASIYIAVEIEKTQKSKKRILYKLRKYSTRTHLDGVIYICDKDSLSEIIRNHYNSSILSQALRVNHYGNNFMLFSDGTLAASGEPVLYNAALQNVSLRNWAHFLTSTHIDFRRDKNVFTSAERR